MIMLTEAAFDKNQRRYLDLVHFTALRFAKSLWSPSTISNVGDSKFPPDLRNSMTQDPDVSISFNGPDAITQIIMINLSNNTTHAAHQIQNISHSIARQSVINWDNFNLHPRQQELLMWHCQIVDHADFQQIQSLISKPSTPCGSLATGHLHE